MLERSMRHLHYNLLCAIDMEITGPNPFYHDICQIAIIPLNNHGEISKKIIPFFADIKPRRPENTAEENYNRSTLSREQTVNIIKTAEDADTVADRFEQWFEKLELIYRKAVVPLAFNWAHKIGYMLDWLGPEHYNQFFSREYRDIMCNALYICDKQNHNADIVTFKSISLSAIAAQIGVHMPKHLDCLERCSYISQVFKAMMFRLY